MEEKRKYEFTDMELTVMAHSKSSKRRMVKRVLPEGVKDRFFLKGAIKKKSMILETENKINEMKASDIAAYMDFINRIFEWDVHYTFYVNGDVFFHIYIDKSGTLSLREKSQGVFEVMKIEDLDEFFIEQFGFTEEEIRNHSFCSVEIEEFEEIWDEFCHGELADNRLEEACQCNAELFEAAFLLKKEFTEDGDKAEDDIVWNNDEDGTVYCLTENRKKLSRVLAGRIELK